MGQFVPFAARRFPHNPAALAAYYHHRKGDGRMTRKLMKNRPKNNPKPSERRGENARTADDKNGRDLRRGG
jgi:hypothetical protein